MGVALDGFIDEDGYLALDVLSELRESYGFRHQEGRMHGAIGPVAGDMGEPDQPLARTAAPRILIRPPPGRNFAFA
jgi:hypothetical protein